MSGPVRVAFLGTPDVAVTPFEALVAADDVEVVVVVTNPDRPRGRSGTPRPSPVKLAARRAGVDVLQPERAATLVDPLSELDLDAAAVVAYGSLLGGAVLATARHGFVNLHFSMLPRWRGAAPVQHAIIAGDEVTGVSTFVLDAGMDTGPLLARRRVAIGPRESAGSLLVRLTAVGAPLLVDSVVGLVRGRLTPTPQPTEGATLAPKLTPDDVRIDWDRPAPAVADLVRGADPRPGAHTGFRGERLKVWHVEPLEHPPATGPPGQIVQVDPEGPVVACGTGAVRLDVVQPAGRARTSGRDFVNGARPSVGERLG